LLVNKRSKCCKRELLNSRQQLATTQQQLDEQRRLLEQVQHARGQSSSLKLPKPATFSGHKREPTPQNWVHAMENYLIANNVSLDNPNSVTLAAGYLADSALTWYRLHLAEVDRGLVMPYQNWVTFKEALLKKFVPIAPEMLARTKLYNIRQTQSVQAYAMEYNMCMLEIFDMSEKDRVDRFVRGLKPEVRVLVQLQKPAALVDAIEVATQIDSIMWQARKGPFRTPTGPSQRFSSGPVPMELGTAEAKTHGKVRQFAPTFRFQKPTIRSIGAPPRKMSSQFGGGGRSNVQCFYCKKQGHIQRDCFKRQRNMASDTRGSPKST